MPSFTITKTRIHAGIWEGIVEVAAVTHLEQPDLSCLQGDVSLDGMSLTATDTAGRWNLRIAIPPHLIGDGIRVFQIIDATTGEKLSHFSILTDEGADDGLREEVALLRAELDLVKKAVRRLAQES